MEKMHYQPESSNIKISQLPLWAPAAIENVENFVRSADRPLSAIEFGSGGSTMFLLNLGVRVLTIEHHAGWADALLAAAEADGFGEMLTILRRDRPYFDVVKELDLNEKFDMLLVDGRERVQCFKNSLLFVREGGLALLDDSQRARYWPVFQSMVDYPGVTFKSKDRDTTIWQYSRNGHESEFSKFLVVDDAESMSFPKKYAFALPAEVRRSEFSSSYSVTKETELTAAVERKLSDIGLISKRSHIISPRHFELSNVRLRIADGKKYFLHQGRCFVFVGGRYVESDVDIFDRPTVQFPGMTLDLSSAGAGRFSFFLLDSIPKLKLHNFFNAGKTKVIDRILINSAAPFMLDVLKLAFKGEPPEIISFNKQNQVIALEESFHFDSIRSSRLTPDWIFNYLSSIFDLDNSIDPLPEGNKRVFISRQRADGRRVINYLELKKVLDDFGFIEIFAEDHTPLEIAKILRSTDILVSPHGAGLVNSIFCRKDVQVIELFSSHFTEQYFNLARGRKQKYTALPCWDDEEKSVFERYTAESPNKAIFNRKDMFVPVDKLISILNKM